jgi:hypothetical protein
MSKQAIYEVELENVQNELVHEAMKLMEEKTDVEFQKNGNRYTITSPDQMTVTIHNGTLKVEGMSYSSGDITRFKNKIQQFYEAVIVLNEMPNTTVEYNNNKELIELKIPEV